MKGNRKFFEYLEKHGKDKSWEELAEQFGWPSGEHARNAWRRWRNKREDQPEEPAYITSRFTEDTHKGEANVEINVDVEIRSLDELITKANIDTEVWDVLKYTQNYWGNSSHPHWQVKAILGRKEKNTDEAVINFLKKYKSSYVPLTENQIFLNPSRKHPVCCLLAITDAHLDKKTLDGQSIEYKIEQYHKVVSALMLRACRAFYVDEIVFTVGHDIFNTDTYYNTTTNGTQQENNCGFEEAYEKIFDCQVKAISTLKQLCNKLHIKYIPSNHARTKEYFLVHALEVYFKADKNIIFDREASPTKVYTYGQNFIGMHHGDTKLPALPLYFAQKYYREWGGCKYKQIFVGDKHRRQVWNTDGYEMEGVRVTMTPHLGGYGQWDKTQLYDNGIQGGICTIFDKEKGRVAELEERI